MLDNSNLAVGAGVGTAIGAGAGFIAGAKKAAKIMKPFLDKKGQESVDAYVKSRQAANIAKIQSTVRASKRFDTFTRIAEKAKADFPSALENAKKLTKSTKIKYVAIAAAAGAAIGLGIKAIANKIKAKKVQETK